MEEDKRIEKKALKFLEMVSKNPSLIKRARTEELNMESSSSCLEKYTLIFKIYDGEEYFDVTTFNTSFIDLDDHFALPTKFHRLVSISSDMHGKSTYRRIFIPAEIFDRIFERCKKLIVEGEREATERSENILDKILKRLSK